MRRGRLTDIRTHIGRIITLRSGQLSLGQLAANTVATSVNKALAATSPTIEGLSKQLAAALKKHANALGKWVIESAQRNERFTALLWWKQALYSPSLQRSYRELSPAGTAIALSFDLGSVSGAPVPLSVEYFISRETIRNVLPENPKMTLAELATRLRVPTQLIRVYRLRRVVPLIVFHFGSFCQSFGKRCQPMRQSQLTRASCQQLVCRYLSRAVWLLRERLAEMLTVPEAKS